MFDPLLPDAPPSADPGNTGVRAWSQPVVIPTYMPLPADKNPMFLEKRVYQGSSGKVYPLPFTDRISTEKTDREYQAVHIENEFVRLMILPELGGRIHIGLDKTNGYNFFYRHDVIKPALVGLAGPWISGGVEFNWPQHHRPSTFMPTNWVIERDANGSATVWCSEHEPMNRMKGMHGICLRPGSSLIEIKVRIYNRTEFMQTFLFWANAGVRVHERYQSFFPPDVQYVADHAKRAMSRFPLCEGTYYGVDYGARAKQPFSRGPGGVVPNDLSWYRNIPVPTSYMAMGSKEDFFGGYDHKADAGIVHVADHHISPGKKQWTWGNHAFGYAWDRHLSDERPPAPYIELMAGTFTDNQPDFSWLMPGETRSWSEYWYPIQKIGPVEKANRGAAVSLVLSDDEKSVRIGVAVTSSPRSLRVRLSVAGISVLEFNADAEPGEPLIRNVNLGSPAKASDLKLWVFDSNDGEVISYQPAVRSDIDIPPTAKEPPLPEEIASNDELFQIGVHLEQYRHATRAPEAYWREALTRDPSDARCNNAMGLFHLRRGEFGKALGHFQMAVATLTKYNPNPRDGEPFYNLGVTLRFLNRLDEAYDAFYKAMWNGAWKSAASLALAEIDCLRKDWRLATEHLIGVDRSQALVACALRKRGNEGGAEEILKFSLEHQDPLDYAIIHLLGEASPRPFDCPPDVAVDIAIDFARAGLLEEATSVLQRVLPGNKLEDWFKAPPMPIYHLAAYAKPEFAEELRGLAAAANPDYCFPHRLEDIRVLLDAIDKNPSDSRAPYYLGNLLYDKRRYEEAITWWEKSVKIDRNFSIPWRNLGIAYFNINHDNLAARGAYERAWRCTRSKNEDGQYQGGDPRILYERDQLWKRLGEKPHKRLAELEEHLEMVEQRDDLAIECITLLNQTGQYETALERLKTRHFQPWEGGEGLALAQWERANIALGRRAFWQKDPQVARQFFEAALNPPESLGEAKHLLANSSEIHYWLGNACQALGDVQGARERWRLAADSIGDFQRMASCPFSELSFYSGMGLRALDCHAEADDLFTQMLNYAQALAQKSAAIDYFATSLPTLLLFDEDLQKRQEIQAKLIEALARHGLREKSAARSLLGDILRDDPNHTFAADLLLGLDWE